MAPRNPPGNAGVPPAPVPGRARDALGTPPFSHLGRRIAPQIADQLTRKLPLNRSSLGRDLDMDRDTVDHYVEVLDRLFLLRLLPAWHRNREKRLEKPRDP